MPNMGQFAQFTTAVVSVLIGEALKYVRYELTLVI